MMLDGTLQGNSVVHCMYIEIVYLLGKGLGPVHRSTGPSRSPFIIHLSTLGSRVHVNDA